MIFYYISEIVSCSFFYTLCRTQAPQKCKTPTVCASGAHGFIGKAKEEASATPHGEVTAGYQHGRVKPWAARGGFLEFILEAGNESREGVGSEGTAYTKAQRHHSIPFSGRGLHVPWPG